MLCENCKEKNATSFCQIKTLGKTVQKYLCQNCRSLLVRDDEFSVNPEFTIKEQHCNSCGTTLKDFIASGYVGCQNCYIEFYPVVKQSLKSVQKSETHQGKIPERYVIKTKIKETEQLLEQAMQNSDLVQVNRLSFKLKQLKGEL